MGRGKGKEVIYEADGDEECQGAFNLLVANSEVVKMRETQKSTAFHYCGASARDRGTVWERREETGVLTYYSSLLRSFSVEGGEWLNGAG